MPEDSEKGGSEPNLELPSLFGRGRKKKRPAEEPPTEEVEAVTVEPDSNPTAETPAPTGPVPVAGSTRRLPPTPPPPARDVEDTAPIPASAPPAEPPVEPLPEPVPVEPAPEPVPVEPAPEPVSPPAPEPTPAPVEPSPQPEPVQAPVEETAVLPGPVTAQPSGGAAVDTPVGAPLFADEAAPPAVPPAVPPAGPPAAVVAAEEEPGRRRAARERKPLQLPLINPRVAALGTGLLVGLVGVLLSFGASNGCEAVRGVGSCGGIGLVALLAVLAIQVILGAALLKAFGLADATSTSFLGVGLVAVLALLFFLSSLDSVWMFLVIPVLTAITFLISWWVTETFVEQGSGDDLHR